MGMGSHKIEMKRPIILFFIMCVSMSMMFCHSSSDADKEREECAEQLVGLATCLPYVGGTAKAPTPDCCTGLKQVLKTNKKCLCVIIKDRNDPNLSLTINVTLALGLPSVCNAPANISQCPELLHLPPNSKDAQIFYQLGHASNNSSSSPAPASSVKPSPATANSATGTTRSNSQKSCGCHSRWLQLDVVLLAAVLCFLFFQFSFVVPL